MLDINLIRSFLQGDTPLDIFADYLEEKEFNKQANDLRNWKPSPNRNWNDYSEVLFRFQTVKDCFPEVLNKQSSEFVVPIFKDDVKIGAGRLVFTPGGLGLVGHINKEHCFYTRLA